MTTEQASVQFDDLRAAAGFLLRHWSGELSGLFRGTLGRFFPSPEPDLVVVAAGDEFLIGHDVDGKFSLLTRQSRSGDAARGLSNTLARFGLAGADANLRFPSGDVLRPTIKLPNARPSALDGALRYELEHLTPLEPSELYFDYEVVVRDRATNTVEIALRIIRKEIIDHAVEICRGAGLKIAAIGFEDDVRKTDASRLPLDKAANLRWLWRRHGNAALVALGGALALLFLATLYMRGNMELDALSDQVADEGTKAARVERISHEIAATRREFSMLAREKKKPLAVAVLAKLTNVLPDGTWATEIEIDGTKVHVQGNSPSASELIARIDASGLFTNAQFDSPVVQDAALHADHFSMTFDVVGGTP
jgi:general secretion pathway protein L